MKVKVYIYYIFPASYDLDEGTILTDDYWITNSLWWVWLGISAIIGLFLDVDNNFLIKIPKKSKKIIEEYKTNLLK